MAPEDAIKKLGIEQGAELVGIASVEDINRYAPLVLKTSARVPFRDYCWRAPLNPIRK